MTALVSTKFGKRADSKPPPPSDRNEPRSGARFPQTRWSVVLGAMQHGNREAMVQLCDLYRRPVVGVFRHLGCSASEADERTQEFFASHLEKGRLQPLEPNRPFRNWLQVCLKRFLWRRRRRDQSQACRGAQVRLSYDAELHGNQGSPGSAPALDSEALISQVWDRLWAEALIERALERLAQMERAKRYPELHAELVNGLSGAANQLSDIDVAQQLGIALASVRVYRHHLRKAFASCLRQEVSRTLEAGECPKQEIQRLHRILTLGVHLKQPLVAEGSVASGFPASDPH